MMRCFWIRHGIVLFLLVICFSPNVAPATEPVSSDSLKELLELSGTAKQVKEIPALVAMGVQQAQSERPEIPSKDFEVFKKDVIEAYGAEAMMRVISEMMSEKIDGKDVVALVSWYKSPAIQAIVKAEVENSTSEKVPEIQAFIADLDKNPLPEPRLSLLNRLDAAIQGSENNRLMIVKSRMGLLRALNKTLSPEKQQTEEAFAEMEKSLDTALITPIRQQVIGGFGFCYRSVSDKDLEEYVAYFEKYPGHGFALVTGEAIAKGMEQAGRVLGEQVSKGLASKELKK